MKVQDNTCGAVDRVSGSHFLKRDLKIGLQLSEDHTTQPPKKV